MEEKTKNNFSFPLAKFGFALAGFLLLFVFLKVGGTFSLFSDKAVVEGITFSASDSFFSPSSVVINEIMWMGSAEDPKDEWIELKNNTDEEVDLSGWNIQYAGKGKEGHIEIPHGHSIKADGYFLILRKKWNETAVNLEEKPKKDEGMDNVAGMDLKDSGEMLVLTDKNKNGTVIDIAGEQDEKWFAGEDAESKKSMQRKDPKEDGEDKENWETCEDEDCSSDEYWKIPEDKTKDKTKDEAKDETEDGTEDEAGDEVEDGTEEETEDEAEDEKEDEAKLNFGTPGKKNIL